MGADLIMYKDQRMLPDENAIPIFLHIPKCGGSTVRTILTKYYKNSSVELCNGVIMDFGHPELLPPQDTMFYSGHETLGLHTLLPTKSTAYYFTIIRDSLNVAKSAYKFLPRRYCYSWSSPDHFLYHWEPNRLVYWLGQGDRELAADMLFSKCVWFGVQERYDDSLMQLCKLFPWLEGTHANSINTSPKEDVYFTQSAIDYFLEKNAADIDLYQKAIKEFEKRASGATTGTRLEKPIHVTVHDDLQSISDDHQLVRDTIIKRQGEESTKIGPGLLVLADCIINNKKMLLDYITQCKTTRPSEKRIAFNCLLELYNSVAAQKMGEEIFLAINKIDGENQVPHLIYFRIEIIRLLATFYRKQKIHAPISEPQLAWLQSLRTVRMWKAEAWGTEALILEANGNLSSALECAREAVNAEYGEKYFLHLFLHEILCRLLLATGGTEEARTMAESELANNPGSEWALRQRALASQALGSMVEAGKAAEKAIEKNPYWQDGWKILCRSAQVVGDSDRAIEYIERGFSCLPEDRGILEIFLNLLVNHCHNEKAKSVALTEIEKHSHWGLPHRILSQIYEAEGQIDISISEAEKAVELQPGDMTSRENLVLLLIRNGRLEQARVSASESLSDHPDQAWLYYQLSMVFEAEGDFERAAGKAEQAFRLQPEKRALAAHWASLLRKQGEYARCRDLCLGELAKSRDQGWAWRELCHCSEEVGDHARALEYGEVAIAVHPEHEPFRQYYHSLGSV